MALYGNKCIYYTATYHKFISEIGIILLNPLCASLLSSITSSVFIVKHRNCEQRIFIDNSFKYLIYSC